MTDEERKKLEGLKLRLDQKTAWYHQRGSREQNEKWWLTPFTYKQHKGNLREMRKIVDELLKL